MNPLRGDGADVLPASSSIGITLAGRPLSRTREGAPGPGAYIQHPPPSRPTPSLPPGKRNPPTLHIPSACYNVTYNEYNILLYYILYIRSSYTVLHVLLPFYHITAIERKKNKDPWTSKKLRCGPAPVSLIIYPPCDPTFRRLCCHVLPPKVHQFAFLSFLKNLKPLRITCIPNIKVMSTLPNDLVYSPGRLVSLCKLVSLLILAELAP